jgi:diketogulonate reductase-like aldo/keto reductase
MKRSCLTLFLFFAALNLVIPQTNLFKGYSGKGGGKIDDVVTTKFRNDVQFPLVGLGVGNLQRNLVEGMIYQGLQQDKRIRMIDTAHQSGNERDVARGITTGVKALKESLKQQSTDVQHQKIQVHVVTKIWYTYLGYDRTKLAVEDILKDLLEATQDPHVDLKVTLLLHWPRCYDTIPWMECEKEEEQLPARVKDAGPAPHLDKKNAWKESWMALEDIYNSADYSVIAAIGVSNFEAEDLQTLLETARTLPHVSQVNVWSVINNPSLIGKFKRSRTHVQVYNVMNGILGNVFNNPKAHHHLLMVANQLEQEAVSKGVVKEGDFQVQTSQIILKWLVQSDYSIIPRTSNYERLAENSAVSLMNIPNMNDEQLEIVWKSMKALMNNHDLEEDVLLKVRFHARKSDMFVYWVDGDKEEKQIGYIRAGDMIEQSTYPGHQFKVYNAQDPDQFQSYAIHGKYGDVQDIHVEL